MEALELRNIVKEYVDTADEKILNIVKAVFETYEKDNNSIVSESDIFYKLIDQGLDDVKHRRIRSHEEVMSDIKKRYSV